MGTIRRAGFDAALDAGDENDNSAASETIATVAARHPFMTNPFVVITVLSPCRSFLRQREISHSTVNRERCHEANYGGRT